MNLDWWDLTNCVQSEAVVKNLIPHSEYFTLYFVEHYWSQSLLLNLTFISEKCAKKVARIDRVIERFKKLL